MRLSKLSLPIAFTAALAVLAATMSVGTAAAGGGAAKASAKRVVSVCSKRARRATRGVASTSSVAATKRRQAALRRRCLVQLRRSSGKRHDAAGSASSVSIGVSVSNAAPAPATEPAPSALVVGIDGGYAGWSESETEQRAALGATVTRHEWDPTQPVDAQDALVLEAASQVGTRIHALLGGNQLGDAGHYRDWVIAFIRRYGLGGTFWAEHPELDEGRYAITTFELGNEPYFGEMSAELYADTVRPALEEVKRLGLPAKVILPSRVYGTDTAWMDTLYQRIPDLNTLFHAFADHPYWYGHDPAEVSPAGPFGRIDVLRRRMNEKGASAKPIFITEYGESTASCGGECVSEAVQAEHLSEMLNAAIGRTEWKVEMISVFQLLDRGTGSGDRELQFGLLRQNGVPKPSYSIVRSAMQQYR